MNKNTKNNLELLPKKFTKKIELTPEVMFADIPENEYKLELELLDRYIKFSSELLRLSLLGIAVVGYIYTNFVVSQSMYISKSTKSLFILGILSFAVSSILAIAHRYISTDAFRFFSYGLRIKNRNSKSEDDNMQYHAKTALKRRRNRLRFGPWLKGFSASFLVLGALLIAFAFRGIILDP